MQRTMEAIRLAAVDLSPNTILEREQLKALAEAQKAGVTTAEYLWAHAALRSTCGHSRRAAALMDDTDETT